MLNLNALAIRWALMNPAPDSIPLSNMDLLRARKYCSVSLDGERRFSCSSVGEGGITGHWIRHIPNDIERIPAVLPFEEVSIMPFEIRQYHGELEFRYKSAIPFLVANLLRIPTIRLWHRRFVAALFKRKRLIRKDQLEVLTYLANRAREGNLDPISVPELITDLYGILIWEHPDRELMTNHYNLWLYALVDRGDVEDMQGRFRIARQGLNTLAQEEREDRRHNDTVKTQWLIAILTAALVLVGILSSFSN